MRENERQIKWMYKQHAMEEAINSALIGDMALRILKCLL
jgi:hypothetical protein